MPPADPRPEPVVVHRRPWGLIGQVVVAAVLDLALVAALVDAVLAGSWDLVDDSTAGQVAAWLGVGLLVPVLSLAIGYGVVRARRTTGRVDLDAATVVETTGGAERARVTLDDAGRLTYLPALAHSWEGSGKAADDRLLLSGRGVGHDRLLLEGPRGARVELAAREQRWDDVVAVLAGWLRRRPDLAADDETTRFLAAGGGAGDYS